MIIDDLLCLFEAENEKEVYSKPKALVFRARPGPDRCY